MALAAADLDHRLHRGVRRARVVGMGNRRLNVMGNDTRQLASLDARLAVLYQRAYALTVAQWRWVIDLMRSGSSIRKRHAFAHAATIAS